MYDELSSLGHSLSDYAERWMNPNGLEEMAAAETRSFGGGQLPMSAVPLKEGADVAGFDHLNCVAQRVSALVKGAAAKVANLFTSGRAVDRPNGSLVRPAAGTERDFRRGHLRRRFLRTANGRPLCRSHQSRFPTIKGAWQAVCET